MCEPWCDVDDVIGDDGCAPCATSTLDADAVVVAIDVATDILWRLTGKRWPGRCTTTVRPCARPRGRQAVSAGDAALSRYAHAYHPSWGVCSGRTPDGCGCGTVPEVLLGAVPIVDILEVRIDGVALAEADYRVDDRRKLVRVDGEGWPVCQDLTLEDTEVGTWSVTFVHGDPPPAAGVQMAAIYACEIAKSLCGDSSCKLPQRVQSISRQGVSMTLLDPAEFVDQGKTGLPLVDTWIKAVNPSGRQARARVSSPDVGPRVRRTSDLGGS